MRPVKASDSEKRFENCLYFVRHYIKYPVPGGYVPCEFGHCISGQTKRTKTSLTCGEFFPRKCISAKDDV